MSPRRIAVLGSNSFAGASFIARALSEGVEVIGFNRSPESSPIFLPYRALKGAEIYRFYQADVNRDLEVILEVMDRFRPEVVVDFAGQGMVAESWAQPEQWYTTNIVAKVRLHDALRRRDWLRRYVRISTPEVYGSQDGVQPESWLMNPSTPYAVSHAATDMSLRCFHQQYGFPVVIARFANFYGPGQQLYRIVPRTIICALAKRKLPLHGSGRAVRAFIYASDIADAIVRAIDAGKPGEIYHFSPQRFVSIRQLVELICERMNVPFADLTQPTPDRPGKDHAYFMDSTRARVELGWRDAVSIEKGIGETIDWVRRSYDEIKSLPWDYVHKA